jgi:hypothetical protein
MAMKSKEADGLLTDTGATAPDRLLTQRLDALQRANVVRTERALVKRDLKKGKLSIHTLLLDPPACLVTAKVFDVLLAVPSYGRVKASKVLRDCRIAPSKTMGGLSLRQRDDLGRALTGLRRPSSHGKASASVSEGESRAPARASADEELMRGLELLLEEARQTGRLAGRLAHEAGAVLDASAPKPDTAELRAAITESLRASDSVARDSAEAGGLA